VGGFGGVWGGGGFFFVGVVGLWWWVLGFPFHVRNFLPSARVFFQMVIRGFPDSLTSSHAPRAVATQYGHGFVEEMRDQVLQ